MNFLKRFCKKGVSNPTKGPTTRGDRCDEIVVEPEPLGAETFGSSQSRSRNEVSAPASSQTQESETLISILP